MQVGYFKIEGYEGQFFSCVQYGTMSPAACAKNFAAAPEAQRTTGRLASCIGCEVGQHHLDPVAPAKPIVLRTALVYRKICVRCRRGGEVGVGKVRLVRGQTICVSCINREAEVIKGRNAKGGKPKKWRHLLQDVQIGSVANGSFTIERFSHPVRDRIEAMLTLLRRPAGPKVMAWTSSRSIQRMEAGAV